MPKGPEYPTQAIINNVVREPRIKFFGVPLLGAYATVPIRWVVSTFVSVVRTADWTE